MDFTEQEVREKLEELGYHDVPRSKLLQFMADLDELIELDLSSALSSANGDASLMDDTNSITRSPLQDLTVQVQSKAFAKEKIGTVDDISFDKENLSVMESTGYSDGHPSMLSAADHTYPIKDNRKSQTLSGMRRKVARKKDGASRIFDESSINDDNELSDITLLEERVRNLPVHDDDVLTERSCSSNSQNYRSKSVSSVNSVDAVLPSFIRPSRIHPHTKNLRKCDPVSRYHQFKEEWKHSKLPGESSHANTRWNVREQMLYCEVFEKPQRQCSVNNYVVPTEKKRQALRWQVRTAMANM